MEISADIVVVGTGVGGLFSTLWLPEEKQVVLITKSDLESSDSFLAQGGICVLRDEKDYESFFEDTMKAGHYENRKESVDLMIRKSREIIDDLIGFGVDFEQEDGCLKYTREGAHSCPRILFHKDITGKEITSKLLERVKERKNVTIFEYTTMTDILEEDGKCTVFLRLCFNSSFNTFPCSTVSSPFFTISSRSSFDFSAVTAAAPIPANNNFFTFSPSFSIKISSLCLSFPDTLSYPTKVVPSSAKK